MSDYKYRPLDNPELANAESFRHIADTLDELLTHIEILGGKK